MAKRCIRTWRPNGTPPVPTVPSDIISMVNWDLAIPTSRAIASGSPGGPYAGGLLKFKNGGTISDPDLQELDPDVAQSNCGTIYPIGSYSSNWFRVGNDSPDGAWELIATAPVWGSCSNPFEGSDHTRTELRSRLQGSAPASGKAEFLQVDKARIRGLCRPTRWPNNDQNGRPRLDSGTIGHNLTVYQIHDLSYVFVIVLFRKKTNGLGRLEFTLRDLGTLNSSTGKYSNPVSANSPIVLADDVPLGSLIEYELVWGPDPNLYSRSRVSRLTSGAFEGFTSWLIQTIPCDPAWANRPQYYKALTYHGTDPFKSDDYLDGKVDSNGVLAPELVTDFSQTRYRYLYLDTAP